jgi:hypothetical protein
MFFAPVLGVANRNLTVSSAATIYGGVVDTLQSTLNGNPGVLPLTYDVNQWNNFMATGLNPDGVATLYNGSPSLLAYPSIKFPGNFGQLSLDGSHAGESFSSNWVNNGMSQSDLNGLLSLNLMPLSKHPANTWDWIGETGLKQSLIATINTHVGQSFMIPLFTPVDPGVPDPTTYQAGVGQGQGFYFDIVQFVGITIVPAPNGGVEVQPCAYLNPNVVFAGGHPVPVGTTSYVITTFAAPKLTQ